MEVNVVSQMVIKIAELLPLILEIMEKTCLISAQNSKLFSSVIHEFLEAYAISFVPLCNLDYASFL